MLGRHQGQIGLTPVTTIRLYRAQPHPPAHLRAALLQLQPRRVLQGLLLIAVVFALITTGVYLTRYRAALSGATIPNGVERVMQLLDVNLEANIPTWFSSAQFIVCAGLTAVIAGAKAPGDFRRHWGALAVIFLLLSLDEAAALHDSATSFMGDLVATGSFFAIGWVIPGIIIVILFVLAYAPFLLRLPPRTRWLFVVAGGLFVFGAVGLEMVGAYYGGLENANTLVNQLIWVVEEFCEMAGVSLFIYALLVYLRDYVGSAGIAIRRSGRESSLS